MQILTVICVALILVILFNSGKAKFYIGKVVDKVINFTACKITESQIVVTPEDEYAQTKNVKIEALDLSSRGWYIEYKKEEDESWSTYTPNSEIILMQNTTIHARYARIGEDNQPDKGPETTKPVTKIAVAGIMDSENILVEYLTLQEAIDECNAEINAQQTEIEILADISLSTTVGNIVENQNILLDLNGKTIETTGTDVYVLKNAGKLEIKDSRAYKENEEDEVEEKDGNIVTSTSNTIYNSKNGELNITSGTIQNTGDEKIAIYNTENAVVNMAGGNIIGGKIVEENITGSSKGIFNYENGRVNILGGTIFTAKVGIKNEGILNSEESPAVLIEGNPTIKTIQSNAISSKKGLTVIKGGFIENPSKTAATPTVINTENSKIIIAGGTIKCGGINAAVYNGLPGSQDEGVIEIRGGNIESSCTAVHNAAKGTIIISGGTITSTEQRGISCVSQGTIIISDGDNESLPSEYPKITGKTNGVDCHGDFIYYDGTIKGMSGSGSAITGVQPVIPEHYRIIKTQEGIEDLETHENIDMETAYLSNEYNVTYNYNIPNYFSSKGYPSEKSDYCDSVNECFQFGKINIGNFRSGDTISITVDIDYNDVVMREDGGIIVQAYGNIYYWERGVGSEWKKSISGTGSCKLNLRRKFTNYYLEDDCYIMQIRADYMVSGKIKVTNVTVKKISDNPNPDKYVQPVVYGTTINTLHEHTERGYEFDGWYTQPEGGEEVTAPIMVTEDLTYYAHWTASNYVEITPANEKIKFYRTLSEAMSNVSDGNTIKVLNNETITEDVTFDPESTGKLAILDIRNKKITLNNAKIINNGNLTIIGNGGSIESSTAPIGNNGTLTIGNNADSNIADTSCIQIIGKTAGVVNTSGRFNFYDGNIKVLQNSTTMKNETISQYGVSSLPEGYNIEDILVEEGDKKYLQTTFTQVLPEAELTVNNEEEIASSVTLSIKPYLPVVKSNTPYCLTQSRDTIKSAISAGDYTGERFRISGNVRTIETANGSKATAIGFELSNSMEDREWKAAYTVGTGDATTAKDFNTIFTVPTGKKYSRLKPWLQINIASTNSGYKVEYTNVKYEHLDYKKIESVSVQKVGSVDEPESVEIQNGVGTFNITENGTYEITVTDIYGNSTTYTKEISNIKNTTYSVTLNPNGGTYNGSTETATTEIKIDSSVQIGIPKREGYKFVKWTTEDNSVEYKNLLKGAEEPRYNYPATNQNEGWIVANVKDESIDIIDIENPPVPGILKGFEIKADTRNRNVAQTEIPITEGSTYTVSVWAKGTGRLALDMGVSTFATRRFNIENQEEWKQYSYTFVAGTNCDVTDGWICAYFGNQASSGTIQICGMRLEEGSGLFAQIEESGENSVTLFAQWEVDNEKTVTYDLAELNDMSQWDYLYEERFSVDYDSQTKLNTIEMYGKNGWEIVYIPIATVIGKKYTFTFDYQILSDYTVFEGNGFGYQALTNVYNSNNSSTSIATGYLPTKAQNSVNTLSLTFTATGTTTYLAFNLGFANDNRTVRLKLGNIKIEQCTVENQITLIGLSKSEFKCWAETVNTGTVTYSEGDTISLTSDKTLYVVCKTKVTPSVAQNIDTKVYDGTTSVQSPSLNNVITLAGIEDGDDVTATANFEYETASAGNSKQINVTNIELQGTDKEKYLLTTTNLTSTGKIEQKEVTPNVSTEFTPSSGHTGNGIVARFDATKNTLEGYNSNTTTWYDTSDNGHDGVLENCTWGENYLELNGTSSWVDLGDLHKNDITEGEMTLEATFSTGNYSGGDRYIISCAQYGGGYINIKGRDVIAAMYIDGSYKHLKAEFSKDENGEEKINNIILSYDKNYLRLYLNGEKVAEKMLTGSIKSPQNSTHMVLGGDPNASTVVGYFFGGKIYSAAVYSKGISEDEAIINANTSLAKAKNQTITYNSAFTKVYDGTTNISNANILLTGAIDGDDVLVTGNCQYESANVGESIPITINNLSLQGADKNNYKLPQTINLSATGSITKATVTPVVTNSYTYASKDIIGRYEGTYNDNGTHNSSATSWANMAGTSYNGTINGATWGENYLEFDGTDDWVNLGYIYSPQMTLEATFSINNVSSTTMDILGNWENSGGGIGIDDKGFIFGEYYIGYTYIHVVSNVKATTNRIYHVSLTYDGHKVILYIDGNIKGICYCEGEIVSLTGNNRTVMALGANPSRQTVTGSYLNGKIYSAAIYSRGLTEDKVKENQKTSMALANGINITQGSAFIKTYDGTTTITGGNISLAGVLEGDSVTATATFSYDSAEVGEYKTVNIENITISGANAGNYELSTNKITTVGKIISGTP